MLKYNPAERISAKAALDHPYFDSLDKSQFWPLPNYWSGFSLEFWSWWLKFIVLVSYAVCFRKICT